MIDFHDFLQSQPQWRRGERISKTQHPIELACGPMTIRIEPISDGGSVRLRLTATCGESTLDAIVGARKTDRKHHARMTVNAGREVVIRPVIEGVACSV